MKFTSKNYVSCIRTFQHSRLFEVVSVKSFELNNMKYQKPKQHFQKP